MALRIGIRQLAQSFGFIERNPLTFDPRLQAFEGAIHMHDLRLECRFIAIERRKAGPCQTVLPTDGAATQKTAGSYRLRSPEHAESQLRIIPVGKSVVRSIRPLARESKKEYRVGLRCQGVS